MAVAAPDLPSGRRGGPEAHEDLDGHERRGEHEAADREGEAVDAKGVLQEGQKSHVMRRRAHRDGRSVPRGGGVLACAYVPGARIPGAKASGRRASLQLRVSDLGGTTGRAWCKGACRYHDGHPL